MLREMSSNDQKLNDLFDFVPARHVPGAVFLHLPNPERMEDDFAVLAELSR